MIVALGNILGDRNIDSGQIAAQTDGYLIVLIEHPRLLTGGMLVFMFLMIVLMRTFTTLMSVVITLGAMAMVVAVAVNLNVEATQFHIVLELIAERNRVAGVIDLAVHGVGRDAHIGDDGLGLVPVGLITGNK